MHSVTEMHKAAGIPIRQFYGKVYNDMVSALGLCCIRHHFLGRYDWYHV
jgi:hypothetical protein